jgi:hypothetical protein
VALGEHAKAVTVADEIRRAYGADNNILYRVTCIYSLGIPAVAEARGPESLTPQDRQLQAEYRDKALASLKQALVHGNKKFYNISVDADLDPIRSDPRFRQVVGKYKKK